MEGVIEIQGKKYPVLFGYGVLRKLGIKWGCKGVSSTFKKVEAIFSEEDGIAFEKEDEFLDLLIAGVEKADPESDIAEVDHDVILEAIMFNPENMNSFMAAFQQLMSGQSGKPQPAPKGRKKTPRKKK